MESGGTKLRGGRTALSIDVEDWFHAENLKPAIARQAWDSLDLRVERNTMRMLDILESCNVRATFFVLGWVAKKCPQLVRAIARAGHEVASHGYGHELIYALDADTFRTDVTRSKHLLEDLTGSRVRGYRAPSFSITDWAIPILQDAGFEYDSSLVPSLAHDRYGKLQYADAGAPISMLGDQFYEIGISCLRVGKRGLPWGGGGYFRLIPYGVWCRGVRLILYSGSPYIFYIHPWEIDPDQPRVNGIRADHQFRHIINLHRCEKRFAMLVRDFAWMRLCDLLEEWKSASATDTGSRPDSQWQDSEFERRVVT